MKLSHFISLRIRQTYSLIAIIRITTREQHQNPYEVLEQLPILNLRLEIDCMLPSNVLMAKEGYNMTNRVHFLFGKQR